jgi:putative SOS response-associated peptidase YedK
VLRAFAMITTASCAPLDARDERMPSLLQMDKVGAWIDETGVSADELKALLLQAQTICGGSDLEISPINSKTHHAGTRPQSFSIEPAV